MMSAVRRLCPQHRKMADCAKSTKGVKGRQSASQQNGL
jgi:hypothetical protein